MTNYSIKYTLTLALLLVLEFSFAQSVINRLDVYNQIWTDGNECLILDNGNILLAGKAADTIAQQQSFHLSLHNEDGNMLNSSFIYDSIHPHTVAFQKNMIQINSNEVFYCYQGFIGDCYYYNLDDHSICNMNAFGWMEEDSINITPYVIKSINDTLVVSGRRLDATTGRFDYVITKIKDKQLISRTIIDVPNYQTSPTLGREEIFCISGSDQYVYIHTDLNGPYLYHMVSDTIQNVVTLNPEYFLYSAYLNDDNHIILCTRKFTYEDDIRFKSLTIAEIDLEGNTIWENDMEGYIEKTLSLNDGVFYSTTLETYVDKIIPAVDGNGYIYIGSEHEKVGEEHYSNAIIGKIDEEGNVLWNRKYRYYENDPAYNGFHDIEPDQYGGYIVYGDVVSPDFNLIPYFRRAWLMRVDVDGLMIDTSVNTTNPSLKVYSIFSISPNPTVSTIQFSQPLSHVSILDVQGKVVMSFSEIKMDELDISELAKGIYIVLGQDDKGIGYRSKFVKE